ncbi:MAG: IS110 family transposase [Ginsengibacter sp.]
MQIKTKFYLGIDVSKLWFDLSLLSVINHQKQQMITERFENSEPGIKTLEQWLKKQSVCFGDDTLLVIENTGIYHRLIWNFCSTHQLPLHIGNAAHIKWSFGITRGKNDIIDSKRLCNYAHKHADELKASPALNPVFIKLKDLMTSRSKLLTQAGSISSYLKELKLSNNKTTQKLIEQAHKPVLNGLKKSIALIEKQILKIIDEDSSIKTNYNLLITVPGIGHLTAVYILCSTNNFIDKISGKQLACYAGVVPFQEKSGTSIKGRNKVHRMANKELKKMLHLCALSAIRYYPEFKQYYDRKKKEGKHSMSILNAIKNKIVLRAVAVVNNQKPYVENFKKAA